MMKKIQILVFITLIIFSFSVKALSFGNPLPSWNAGPTKKALLDFVQATTDKSSPYYVPVEERIAAFDQDGTLWVEKPMYNEVIFTLDRIIALAPKHPEWKHQEPFKSLIAKDTNAIAKFASQDFEKIIAVTHTGMSPDVFQATVKEWLKTAKHPRWQRPYTELIYQPMLEVLNFLRAHGYKTYIVTGSSQEFVRAYAKQIYGIPNEQVIGLAFKIQYSYDKQGRTVLTPAPKILINNNLSGKPEGIYLFLGRQPQITFGNSTGDQQMLEYTQTGKGARLMLLVHHDDAEREYAYGAQSRVGTFSDALMSEAKNRGWHVISMRQDWKRIFPFDKK